MQNIKSMRRAICCTVTGFIFAGLALKPVPALSWPTTSPSARQAARLKYNPPRNWLQHYLGDDRYKIAGGTWKVVSTQTDDNYHRADCPNILRQSQDIVIGFPSAAHAREAGYYADPLCDPENTTATPYGMTSQDFQTNLNGRGGRLVGQRITLSDGTSTIVLPKGWKRTKGPSFSFSGITAGTDILSAPGKGHVDISIVRFNRQVGVDFSKLLTVQGMRASRQTFQNMMSKNSGNSQSSAMLNQLSAYMETQKFDSYRLGGLQGVRTRSSGGVSAGMFGAGGRQSIAAGSRSKVYQVSDSSASADMGNSIIASFRAR